MSRASSSKQPKGTSDPGIVGEFGVKLALKGDERELAIIKRACILGKSNEPATIEAIEAENENFLAAVKFYENLLSGSPDTSFAIRFVDMEGRTIALQEYFFVTKEALEVEPISNDEKRLLFVNYQPHWHMSGQYVYPLYEGMMVSRQMFTAAFEQIDRGQHPEIVYTTHEVYDEEVEDLKDPKKFNFATVKEKASEDPNDNVKHSLRRPMPRKPYPGVVRE